MSRREGLGLGSTGRHRRALSCRCGLKIRLILSCHAMLAFRSSSFHGGRRRDRFLHDAVFASLRLQSEQLPRERKSPMPIPKRPVESHSQKL